MPVSKTEERPRLLLLITELQMGGAARVFRDHATILAAHFDVHEVVFDERSGLDFGGKEPPLSLDHGAPYRGPLRSVVNLMRRVWRLRRIKRELGIKVCVSHLEGAHFVDILSRQGEKTVLCVHGSILHNRAAGGRLKWLRHNVLIPFLYSRADRVVTVSRDIVPELTHLGVDPNKLGTINNFFDIDVIADAASEPIEPGENAIFSSVPVIVAASRIHEQKNPLAMMRVFAGIRRSVPARLLWLGDGPLRVDVKKLALDLGLTVWDGSVTPGPPVPADVYFLGNRANPHKYIARSTIFVLPSLWEGFPMALCEAMACGVPVVAADCPTGPREILGQSEFGLLNPMIDDEETTAIWVETLRGLLQNEAERRRFANAGTQRVQEFATETIAPRWVALLKELAAA